jgi:hypothetical protein
MTIRIWIAHGLEDPGPNVVVSHVAEKNRGKSGMRSRLSSAGCVLLAALLVLVVVSCVSAGSKGHECVRELNDGDVRAILGKLGLVAVAYEASIHWTECKYYIAIWELPVNPDTQKIVVLDSRGKLIEGPL